MAADPNGSQSATLDRRSFECAGISPTCPGIVARREKFPRWPRARCDRAGAQAGGHRARRTRAARQGLGDDSTANLKSKMNPMLEATRGDLLKLIVERHGPQMTAALQKDARDLQVYDRVAASAEKVVG